MQRFCPRGAIPFHQLSWWLGLSAVNSVKQFIKQKEEELKQCEIDQLRMNEEKQKNKKLLNWIESRINEINRILDI